MKSIIFNQHQVNHALNNKEAMFRVVVKNASPIITIQKGKNNQHYAVGDDWAKSKFEVGETIFVKESFSKLLINSGHQYYYPDHCIRECVDRDNGFHYWADGNPEFGDWESPRPASHMKQEHSRLTLRIKSVKVERLQDISEEDCLKEGVYKSEQSNPFSGKNYRAWEGNNFVEPENTWHRTAQSAFAELWNSTHKKPEEKFEASPWVFAYEYEVIKNN